MTYYSFIKKKKHKNELNIKKFHKSVTNSFRNNSISFFTRNFFFFQDKIILLKFVRLFFSKISSKTKKRFFIFLYSRFNTFFFNFSKIFGSSSNNFISLEWNSALFLIFASKFLFKKQNLFPIFIIDPQLKNDKTFHIFLTLLQGGFNFFLVEYPFISIKEKTSTTSSALFFRRFYNIYVSKGNLSFDSLFWFFILKLLKKNLI